MTSIRKAVARGYRPSATAWATPTFNPLRLRPDIHGLALPERLVRAGPLRTAASAHPTARKPTASAFRKAKPYLICPRALNRPTRITGMAERRMSLLQAVSLNMSMMVGTGIFITLPALMDTLKGPQAMIGWILGGLIALADGMVWSELAAAFPGSGGTYHFYDAAYGKARVGRILKFLFVWQFFFSGPLEIATGAIGMVKYLGYFVPILRVPAWNWGQIFPGVDAPVALGQVGAMGVMVLVTVLAYRRISVAAQAHGRAVGRDADHGGFDHCSRFHALGARAGV